MKKAHNEEIHIDGGEQGHKCEFCEKAFFRKESVRRHIREAHEGKLVKEEGVIYECGQCEKKYERRDVLRRHVRLVHEAVQVKEALLTRLTRYVNFMNFDFLIARSIQSICCCCCCWINSKILLENSQN